MIIPSSEKSRDPDRPCFLNIYALFFDYCFVYIQRSFANLNKVVDLLNGVINESVRQHLSCELVSLGIQVFSQLFLSNPQIVNDIVVHNLDRALDIISVQKEDLKRMSDPRARNE